MSKTEKSTTRFHLFRRGEEIPAQLAADALELSVACQPESTIIIDRKYLEQQMRSHMVLIAEVDGVVAATGASQFYEVEGNPAWHLRGGYVRPEFRGRGLLFELLWQSTLHARQLNPAVPPTGFCVTRSPQAYASLERVFDVWPRPSEGGIEVPEEIRSLAGRVAELALPGWTLDPETLLVDCPLQLAALEATEESMKREDDLNGMFRSNLDYKKAQGFMLFFRGPKDAGLLSELTNSIQRVQEPR